MLVFEPAGATHASHVVLLFGAGLIGRSIEWSLVQRGNWAVSARATNWQDERERLQQLDRLVDDISRRHAGDASKRPLQFDVIWAAGRAGFGATSAQAEAEVLPFSNVLDLPQRLREQIPGSQVRFHFLSSAGGLYEDQRFVDSHSPRPLRPYGELKMEQERLVAARGDAFATLIYRPSSVYGFNGPGTRLGLIAVLIANALRRTPSRIFGRPDTIRDYVLASDIGDFIAARVVSPDPLADNFILASGRPACLFEIIQIIERCCGCRLYLQYEAELSNAGHNSFSTRALPAHWSPVDLETGIRLTANMVRTYLASPEHNPRMYP